MSFPPTNRRHWLGTAAGLALSPALQAQSGAVPGVTGNQVLIGQVISLQAGKNDHGVATRQGADAALRAVNAAGGVQGRQLVIRVADDEAKPAQAEALARQLVAEGVFLLFGSIEGGPSTAVMKAAVDSQVPFIGPMAGSPGFRRPFQPLVFPVRAEHRDEYAVLLQHGRSLGMRRHAFLQSDSPLGREHLVNVNLAAQGLGLPPALPLVVGAEVSDAQLDTWVAQLAEQKTEFMFNHGSIGVYERLIRRARARGLSTAFFGVNSGSAQLAKHLGPLGQFMVFTQVVPSPWERKTALTREYQVDFKAAFPDQDFSYGSLEGYLTLRVLAEGLRRAGRELSRPGLVRALESAPIEVAGYKVRYSASEHTGSTFVDTALVTREGRFRH